jgi:hypothetical protein
VRKNGFENAAFKKGDVAIFKHTMRVYKRVMME